MRNVLTLAALVAATSAAAEVDQVAFGRQIAEANCAVCHAISTSDASRHPEAPPLRALSARYPLDALEEAFVEGIYVGHPDMPQFQASPEQVEALLAYLDTIQDPAPDMP